MSRGEWIKACLQGFICCFSGMLGSARGSLGEGCGGIDAVEMGMLVGEDLNGTDGQNRVGLGRLSFVHGDAAVDPETGLWSSPLKTPF